MEVFSMVNPAADFGAIIEVEGRTDQEINDSVSSQASTRISDTSLTGWRRRSILMRPEDRRYPIRHQRARRRPFVRDDSREWKMRICERRQGPARLTVAVALPDFLRLIGGKLDRTWAVMSGRLRVSGDVQFAQTIQTGPPRFKRPKK